VYEMHRDEPQYPPPYKPTKSPKPPHDALLSSESAEQFALSGGNPLIPAIPKISIVASTPNRSNPPSQAAFPRETADPYPADRYNHPLPLSMQRPSSATSGQIIQLQLQPSHAMELDPDIHKNAKGMSSGPDGDREWSHKFCNCCEDSATCWMAYFLPCMVYASNKRRLEHLTKYDTPEPTRFGGACGSNCCIYAGLAVLGYGWTMQLGTRAILRSRYRIRGGGCSDCCAAAYCTSCQLTQDSRELELEERSIVRWALRADAGDTWSL